MAAADYNSVVQQLYVAYFGRPADPVGLANFTGQLNAIGAPTDITALNAAYNTNSTVKALVDQFGTSAESAALYTGSTAAFVNAIYSNVLNRTADLEGLLFWSAAIDNGSLSRGKAAMAIMQGALANTSTQGLVDAAVVNNKITVAANFTTALDTTAEVLAYSGNDAAASARSMLQTVTNTTDTTAFQATVTSTITAIGNIVVPGTTYTLTTGLDTVTGSAGNDTINASTNNTWSAFDNIDGGNGTDTMTVLTSDTAAPGGIILKNVETLNINTSGAGYTIDSTGYTGLTKLQVVDTTAGAVSVTAAATTDVTANATGQATNNIAVVGGKAVSVSATGTTTGTITVGATTAAKGAVTIVDTGSAASAAAVGAISVTGGTTVSITQTTTNSTAINANGANGTATGSAVTVTGTADTTSVTVKESAPVTAVAGVAAVTESADVQFGSMTAGQTFVLGGLTFTSTGATTAAQAAAAFASVANGGVGTSAFGTFTGTLTGWSTAAVSNTDHVVFTSATANSNVADLANTGAGAALGAGGIVVTQGAAFVQGVMGVAAGNVTITDANSASTTAAGTITSVSLENFGAATANSGALNTVTLAGKGASFTQTNGALTTATVTAEALNLNGVTTTGAVTLGAVPKTVNIVSGTAANSLNSLSATGATAVNISGDKALTLTSHAFDAAAVITSTSTGAVTISDALAAGQKYVGGAGVDTITLGASGTTAITTGAGNDIVTYAGVMGTGGSVDAGDGTDTIVMTAGQAVTATGSTAFAATVANFEVLKLSAATGGATAINMANADGMNSLDTNGVTVGALTVTNAAADFTLTQRAALAFASSVALATDTGASDNVNLAYTAADGFTSGAALTIANVESLKITTTDADTTAQTAVIVTPITAAAATTVTVAGNMGVSLIGGMTQTTLTSLDASGLTASGAFGGLTWTSGALAAAATVKGGAAGTNTIDFSAATKAVTYTGGSGADTLNFASANAQANVITLGDGANTVNGGTNATGNNTITGGSGVDTILVANGNNTITAGAGNDLITVGSGANVVSLGAGNDTLTLGATNTSSAIFTTVTDIAAGDVINNGALTAFANATGKLGAALTSGVNDYQTFLNNAAGKGAGVVSWFQFGGDTYLVEDVNAGGSFVAGNDIVVKLTGLIDLSNSTLVNGGHALTIV